MSTPNHPHLHADHSLLGEYRESLRSTQPATDVHLGDAVMKKFKFAIRIIPPVLSATTGPSIRMDATQSCVHRPIVQNQSVPNIQAERSHWTVVSLTRSSRR